MQNNLNEIRKRKQELLNYLEQAKQYRAKTIKFTHNLKDQLKNKEIVFSEFKYKLNLALKNKSLDEWVSYYDDLIQNYNKEIININNKLKEDQNTIFNANTILILLFFLIFSVVGVILIKPQITGLVIYNSGEIINDTLTLTIPENITINETIVKVSLNSQLNELSLTEFNILDNLVTIELNKFNLNAEDGTLIAQIIFNNTVIAETSLLIEIQQI
ncbi:MAG: hypothetical protein AABW45_03825, partial [Nanoarchaeota archaeon]